MTHLRQRMIENMKLRGLSPATQKLYLSGVIGYAKYFNRPPDQLSEDDLRKYLLHISDEKKLSASRTHHIIYGLKILYETVLGRDWSTLKMCRVKKEQRLPAILSKEEVTLIFSKVHNLKHRAILMTIYSAGLRLSEAVHLKINNIDSSRRLIKIVQSKNNADRYVLLADRTLAVLRDYYREYRPVDWLFPGGKENMPVSARTIQNIFKRACIKARITKQVSVHSLRHSFATHLMEDGINLRYIQTLLGHRSTKTTARYTHVCAYNITKLKSPIDSLPDMPAASSDSFSL